MSEDREPSSGDVLHIEVKHDRTEATIVLVGELDLNGTECFKARVIETLATRPEALTVEARSLTFIDSSGLTALLLARAAAVDAGGAFRVSEPSPALRRLAKVAGVDDLLTND